MKTIAFFNNKGGVGKTSLVYHLAWIFRESGHRIIAVDLDPQANLSGMFLNETRLEELWQGPEKKAIDGDIAPLFEGTGDISGKPHIEEIEERLGLLVGDLNLSKREGDLSEQWPKCLDRDKRAFRVTTAFARLVSDAGKTFQAELALLDVGPNLVLFPGDIDMFRAIQRRQDKAQPAENGAPLSRAATPYWRRCAAPCGRAGKRSPAALRRLARTRHSRRSAPCAQPLPGPLNMSISPGKSTRGY